MRRLILRCLAVMLLQGSARADSQVCTFTADKSTVARAVVAGLDIYGIKARLNKTDDGLQVWVADAQAGSAADIVRSILENLKPDEPRPLHSGGGCGGCEGRRRPFRKTLGVITPPRQSLQFARTAAVLSSLATSRSDGPSPTDTATISSPAEKPKTPIGRLLRAGRNLILGTLASSTVLGAIGVVHNYDALTHISTSNPVQTVTLVTASFPAPEPAQTPVMSPTAARQLFATLTQNPDVQKVVADQVARLQTQVQQRMNALPAFQQTQLMDVTAPLPTGQGALLQVGSLPLPSMGVHDLQSESIPMVVSASAKLGSLPAHIAMQPEQVADPGPGPNGGVYLGSFHTTVTAAAPSVQVAGDVHIGLDLDGAATKHELAHQQAALKDVPAGSEQARAIAGNIARLQSRLTEGQRIATLAKQNGFDKQLQAVMADQGSHLQLNLGLPQDKPLADGYDHLWLVPGQNGGPPHLAVTDQLSTPGLDRLQVPAPQLSALPHKSSQGALLEGLRDVVQHEVQKQVASTFNQVAGTIPAQAQAAVRQQWDSTGDQLSTTANQAIDHLYDAMTRLQVSVEPTLQPVPPAPAPTVKSPPAAEPAGTPLPAQAFKELFAALQQSPAFQAALQQKVAAAQGQVQHQLDHMPGLDRSDMVDVQTKLPDEVAQFLGTSTLSAPLTVTEHAQVSPVKVKVQVAPVTPRQTPATPAGMIYLGSYQTSVFSQTPSVHVQADGRVSLDLDGKSTQAALQQMQAEARGGDLHSARGQALNSNIERLQKRLASIEQLSKAVSRFGMTKVLQSVMADQGVTASMDIPLSEKTPLLVGTANIFLAPGGPDGLPRLVLTQDSSTPGLDGLKVGAVKTAPLPHQTQNASDPMETVHQILAERIQQAAGGLVQQASTTMPAEVAARARDAWAQAMGTAQATANDAVQKLVEKGMKTPPVGLAPVTLAIPGGKAVTPHVSTPVPDGSMLVVVPPATMARMMAQMQTSPDMQKTMSQTVADMKALLAHPPASNRTQLMDIPVAGFDIPLKLQQHIQPDAIPGKLQITPEVLPQDQRPVGPAGAAYLGSYKSELYATNNRMGVTGQVDVSLDTTPDATQAQIASDQTALKTATGADAQALQTHIAAMQHRLAVIQELQGLKLPPAAQKAVDALTHQQMDVQSTVTLPTDKPLLTGVDHLWLTKDGIAITSDVQTPGAAEAGLTDVSLKAVPHAVPAGFEAEQSLLARQIEQHGRDALTRIQSQLPTVISGMARSAWDSGQGRVQAAADQALARTYAKTMDVPFGQSSLHSGPVPAHIVRLVPTPQGDVAAVISAPGAHESFAGAIQSTNPTSGMDSVVSGSSVNSLLRDKSEGGNMDWNGMLRDMARKQGIKSLELNRDAQGRLMTPHLVMRNGQLRAEFDMTAEVSGLRPVGMITGVLNGATGGLKHAGPLAALHAITGGIKTVLDHTVGVVVDTLPDLATRPVVSVHVSVPLSISTSDGIFNITPQAQGLEITGSQGHNDKTVLPTQLPGSAIGEAYVKSHGAQMFGSAFKSMGVAVDLRDQGLRFTGAQLAPGSGTVPDIHVQMQVGRQFDVNALSAKAH